MSESDVSYVVRTPEGGWRVSGSRISIDSVVHAYWEGRSTEAIAEEFPSLSLEQIHGALAYYLRNREEIDQYLIGQDAHWEELRKASEARHAAILQRLRSVKAQKTE